VTEGTSRRMEGRSLPIQRLPVWQSIQLVPYWRLYSCFISCDGIFYDDPEASGRRMQACYLSRKIISGIR